MITADESKTHTVKIATRCPPLREAITAVGYLCEGVLDITIDHRVVTDVDLVPIRMGIGSAGMSNLRTSCDD